jgi:uncharacterized membrane protein YqaE (UPF0057 family)
MNFSYFAPHNKKFNHMKKINLLVVLACIMAFASCSVEKRVHRKGFHVEWRGQKQTITKAEANEVTLAAAEEVAVEEVATVATVEPVLEPAAPIAVESTESVAVAPQSESVAAVAKQEISKRDLRKAAREVKAEMRNGLSNVASIQVDDASASSEPSKGLLIVLCFLIPTLAVFLYEGEWTNRVLVNLILTALCGIPGVIHALVIIIGDK